MGITQTVANQIVRWAVRRSSIASSAPRIGSLWGSDFPVSPTWDTTKAIAEGYEASYIYYSVSSDLADCQQVPTWGVYRGGKLIEHPLMEMIRRPNSQQTWGGLLELWDLDKSLAGNAYGYWEQIGDRLVMWRLRPDRVQIKPYKQGPLKGQIDKYLYGLGTEPEAYPPEQIVHFRFAHPGDDYFGMSPLRAAARLVNTSNAGLEWHENTIRRGAKPDMLLTPKLHLEPQQHQKLLELMQEQIQGPKNAHRPLLASEPMEILFASMTPADLDFLSIFGPYEDGICKVLDVDPDAMGKTGATYENKEWAIRAKGEGPITSRARETRARLNLSFREPFGTADPRAAGPNDISINYDMSETPWAQSARKERLVLAPKIWACGVPWNALNERLDLGFEPVDGGDVGYVPATMLPSGSPSSEGRSIRAVNPREGFFDVHYRAIDRRRQGWERGVAEKVTDRFSAERSAVVKAVTGGTIDTDPVIDAGRSEWEGLIGGVMRNVIKDFGDQVADELNPPRSQVGPSSQTGTEELSEHRIEVRDGYEFDPWTPAVQKWVKTRTAKDVKAILTTTKKAIRRVVLDGMNEGLSMPQIAKQIGEQFKHWEKGTGTYRAMLIARTEVHNAAGYGMHESARQSGVAQQKHWLDAGDDRVRDAHAANTAEGWIDFDQAYQNGATFPGDGTDDVGCRCVELYRTST